MDRQRLLKESFREITMVDVIKEKAEATNKMWETKQVLEIL